MTDAVPRARTLVGFSKTVAAHPLTMWGAFIAAHVWLGLLNLDGPGNPFGDVELVYARWMDQGVLAGYWVGIDGPWVYPVLALIPMVIARALGPELYGSTWLTLVLVLDCIALARLTSWGRSRQSNGIGWWWIAFLVALGPIALGRIDAVTVAIALYGVAELRERPRVAAAILAVATWMKVWPAALVLALVVAPRDRVRVIAAAAVVSGFVVALALAFGSGANVLSFIAAQTGRGLQVEAPVSTPFLWLAAAGTPGYGVYYDRDILTFQVLGEGSSAIADVMTPLLVLVVAAIVGVAAVALRRGAVAEAVLPPLALGLVVALIAINKVGSPQFISWLAVPVVLGLIARRVGSGLTFAVPAALAIVLAVLTQLVYPTLYDLVLALDSVALAILTIRNVLELVLLGWAVRELVVLARTATRSESRIVEPEEEQA